MPMRDTPLTQAVTIRVNVQLFASLLTRILLTKILLVCCRFYQSKKKHVITTQTEHKCVLDSCRQLEAEGIEVIAILKKIIKICFIYIFPFEIGVEGGPYILSSKLFMANVSYLSSLPSFFGHSLESSVVDPDPNWIRIQELPGSDPHI